MRIFLLFMICLMACEEQVQVAQPVPKVRTPDAGLVLPQLKPPKDRLDLASFSTIYDGCTGPEHIFTTIPMNVWLQQGNQLWGGDAMFGPILWFETCWKRVSGATTRIDCNTEIPWQPYGTTYGISRTLYLEGDYSEKQFYQESISWSGGSCTSSHNLTFR